MTVSAETGFEAILSGLTPEERQAMVEAKQLGEQKARQDDAPKEPKVPKVGQPPLEYDADGNLIGYAWKGYTIRQQFPWTRAVGRNGGRS